MKNIKIIELRKEGFKSLPFTLIDGNNGQPLYVLDKDCCETDARISSTEVRHITRDENKAKLNKLLEDNDCVEIGRYFKGGRFESSNIFIRKP
ncbi:MAG: hypothetical protein GY907_06590 [Bacteroidetes bacterium]|nr:hypothetical protein [Bacteroidota bacterium]